MFDTSWSTKFISLFVALIVVLPSCITHPDRPNFKSNNPLSSRNQITPATLTPIASFLNIGTPINLTDLPSTIVPLTSTPATLNQSNLVHPIPLQQGTSSRSAISIIKPISEEPRQTRGGTFRGTACRTARPETARAAATRWRTWRSSTRSACRTSHPGRCGWNPSWISSRAGTFSYKQV